MKQKKRNKAKRKAKAYERQHRVAKSGIHSEKEYFTEGTEYKNYERARARSVL